MKLKGARRVHDVSDAQKIVSGEHDGRGARTLRPERRRHEHVFGAASPPQETGLRIRKDSKGRLSAPQPCRSPWLRKTRRTGEACMYAHPATGSSPASVAFYLEPKSGKHALSVDGVRGHTCRPASSSTRSAPRP